MLNRTWQKAALAGVGALALTACATSTPYEPAGDNGYGFTEQKIEDDRYRITFRGNTLTDRDQVENYLLLRAAELTLDNGYDHFVVVEDETEKTTRITGTTLGPGVGAGFYPFYGFGRPFPYYGYGYPWGPGFGPAGFGAFGGGFGGGFGDVNLRERNKYTAIAYVKMGRGEKPDVLTAYDASEVAANLAPLVLEEQAS